MPIDRLFGAMDQQLILFLLGSYTPDQVVVGIGRYGEGLRKGGNHSIRVKTVKPPWLEVWWVTLSSLLSLTDC
jgi:hypothetical protein